MEGLFEFLFGASGRINRAKYWRSVLIFIVAGLMTAVILFTAAGIAAPLFVIMVVLVLIPWLLWGFSVTTERLHDRDKSAWWLVVFYLVPGVLGQTAKATWFGGIRRHGAALHPGAGGFCAHDLGICRNRLPARHRRPNTYGPDPLVRSQTTEAEWSHPKTKKRPMAIRPPGG